MNTHYIVARYNENIEWLKPLWKQCIVYNKGEPLPSSDQAQFLDYQERPNLGRESETYLNHIIENYNNLPEILVFTQACIADHRGSDDPKILESYAATAAEKGISTPFMLPDDINWGPAWNRRANGWYMESQYRQGPIVYRDWFTKTIYPRFPDAPYAICSHGIFAVQKANILALPIDTYKRLIQEVNWSSNPIESHFFERAWYYLFTSKL